VRLLIDLLTNIVELRDGVPIEDSSKVVDVVRRAELRYGLGVENECPRKN